MLTGSVSAIVDLSFQELAAALSFATLVKSLLRRGACRRAPPRRFASFDGVIVHAKNSLRTRANRRWRLPLTLLEIARGWPVLGAARGRLAVDDSRGDSAEAAMQRGVGAPHLDHDADAWPSANSRRDDLTKGHALTHSTRSPRRAVHFRPLAVGWITICNGAARSILIAEEQSVRRTGGSTVIALPRRPGDAATNLQRRLR